MANSFLYVRTYVLLSKKGCIEGPLLSSLHKGTVVYELLSMNILEQMLLPRGRRFTANSGKGCVQVGVLYVVITTVLSMQLSAAVASGMCWNTRYECRSVEMIFLKVR